MQNLLKESIGLFSVLFLLILLILINIRKEIHKFSSRLLVFVVAYLTILISLDIFLDLVREGSILLDINVSYLFFTLELFLPPIIAGMIVSYFDYKLIGNLSRIIKRHYYMHFLYVIIGLSFLNYFYPLFFIINNETGLYERAPYYYLMFFGNYLMYGFIFLILIKRRRFIEFKPILMAVLFFILPIMGSVLEMLEVTDSFTWPLMGLACLFIYVYLETTTGTKDFLTNLYTRQTLDDYLKFMIEKKKDFTLLMIDLDKFKNLNDEQGHHMGDLVLKEFSKMLQETYDEKMIARLGGDEFIVIVEKEKDIVKLSNDLQQKLKAHPRKFMKQIRFSYGYERYIEALTMDKLFMKVDQRLYQQKEEKKSRYYHQRY
jgi:diguanylate cyclase (GGDEF)-like protein